MTSAVQERSTAPDSAPETQLPVSPPPPAGAPLPAPAVQAAVMQRGSVLVRLRAWLRLAYTDLGSKEHQVLLEWIIWLVIVSVVSTVLQHDLALDTQYLTAFRVLEGVIFGAFVTDYSLNLFYAPSRRGYAFSFAGIVDLLAILPTVLVFIDLSSVKFLRSLRFLRFLRILQVVKAIQHRHQFQGTEDESRSLLLDLQLSVIGISALLLLVPDDALRNMLLMCTLAVAITTGIRRWLVFRQKPVLSIAVLLATVVCAILYTLRLDEGGNADWATWFLVGSVLVAGVTWFQIEGPAGI